jgi:hypothetical protein
VFIALAVSLARCGRATAPPLAITAAPDPWAGFELPPQVRGLRLGMSYDEAHTRMGANGAYCIVPSVTGYLPCGDFMLLFDDPCGRTGGSLRAVVHGGALDGWRVRYVLPVEKALLPAQPAAQLLGPWISQGAGCAGAPVP